MSEAREFALPPDTSTQAVTAAIDALRSGGMVIVVDDVSDEVQGDLVCAGQSCDDAAVAFMRRHGSGLIKVAMSSDRLSELGIHQMTEQSDLAPGPAFAVSVDARHVTSGGVSTADRARTIQRLADPKVGRGEFSSPGHVFPVRARPGGVLVNAGHTEAAIDLCQLAGLPPVAAFSEVLDESGSMAQLAVLKAFAAHHGTPIVSVKDLIAYRLERESIVQRTSQAALPTRYGTFDVHGYRVVGAEVELEQVALTLGDVSDGEPVLVRVHRACFAADVLTSLACDCRSHFEAAMRRIAAEGRGVLVYVRSSTDAIGACQVQITRAEIMEAEQRLGLRASQRQYGVGAQILRDLGVRRMRLLTNYEHKLVSLYGLEVVDLVPLDVVHLPPASEPTQSSVDSDRYRALAGSFPTGVTVVTTRDPSDDSPKGLTSQTFVGLSTEPPLAMISVAKTSRTLPSLLRARAFVVNFLHSEASWVSDRFASKDEDKFRDLTWSRSNVAQGAPILRDYCVAYAECNVVEVHEAGDHWIFVGRVDGGELLGGVPLLYFRRTYAPWPGVGAET